VRSRVYILPGNEESVAAKTGGRFINTVNGERLAILQSENPIRLPSSQYRVYDSAAVGQIAPPDSYGQLIGAAQMKNFGDIEVTQAVISLDTESGK
jgi:hypothetical protein